MVPQQPAMAMQPAMMAPGTQSAMAPKMMPQAGHAQPIPEHEPKHEEPDFDAVPATDDEEERGKSYLVKLTTQESVSYLDTGQTFRAISTNVTSCECRDMLFNGLT